MKSKLLMLTIFGLALGGIFIFVYPSIKAQISQTQIKQNEEALQIVKSRPISNTFFEALKVNEGFKSSNLKLIKAVFNEQSQDVNSIRTGDFEEWYFMEFQNNDSKAIISIYEYKSPEMASKVLNTLWYSQGTVTIAKEFGDEGIKGFDNNGKFIGTQFRKDRFLIYISCDSEELTKSFAENALKAI